MQILLEMATLFIGWIIFTGLFFLGVFSLFYFYAYVTKKDKDSFLKEKFKTMEIISMVLSGLLIIVSLYHGAKIL